MKALIQRVSRASVAVDGEVWGEIGPGLVVLLGVAQGDEEKDAEYLAQKIAYLRIFADAASKFNRSLLDVGGEMLVVSQFTLLADASKGRRPSFTTAAEPQKAEALVERFVGLVRGLGVRTATGRFGAHMMVEIHNDGPVTLMLDSKS